MDDEKLEREAAKLIFSAQPKPESAEVVRAKPQGPEILFVAHFVTQLIRSARAWRARRWSAGIATTFQGWIHERLLHPVSTLALFDSALPLAVFSRLSRQR
jgi:hypothetical protein